MYMAIVYLKNYAKIVMGDFMQRYFIEKSCIDGDIIHIDSFNHKHIQKVMRYQNGDSLICILPNEDVYIGVIKDIDSGTIQLVEKREENQELDVDATRRTSDHLNQI